MNTYHIPVMLKEVLLYLEIKPGHWYIDCNLGGGGHTKGMLDKGGKVLGIDLDPDAIREVAKSFGLEVIEKDSHLFAGSERLILVQDNFSHLALLAPLAPLAPSGILFDLGVSTHQLDTPDRGFSFNTDAPLDMRMNLKSSMVTAADLVNGLYEKELAELFWNLGEENFSRPIAKRIVEARLKKKIETTNELAQIILSVRHRTTSDRTHPATRVFQALRIAVNDELNSLKTALPQALEMLTPGGKIAVISFHSLEDRIVKDFFRDEQEKGTVKFITKKPVSPTEEEVENNPRSRSGKLRVAEKI